jgi:cytochrome P450
MDEPAEGRGVDRRDADLALTERAPHGDAIRVEKPARPLLERAESDAELSLPPGPRGPARAQAMAWLLRPVPFMERARRRYGKVFLARLGPEHNVVFLSDPELSEAVFTGDSELLHTGDINGIFRRIIGPNSILLLDGDEHLRRRRLLLPVFHGESLRRFERAMEQATEAEIDTWPVGRPFSALPRIHKISTEVVMRAIFGTRDEDAPDAVRDVLPRFLELCRTPAVFMPGLRRELGGRSAWGKLLNSIRELDEILLDQIRRRRMIEDLDVSPERFRPQRTTDVLDPRPDLLSRLVQARDEDGDGLSDGEIRDELITLLVAGHETTSGAIAFAVEQLVHHPRVLDRFEVAIADGEERYLDAVVKESLRRRPVLPIVGRKLTARARVGDYVVPEGTVLLPCVYLLHNDPDVYPHPEEFDPERFLGDSAGTYTWIPFGGGIRRCVGAAFATLEIKVVLRTIFGRLSVRSRGSSEAPVRRSVSLAPRRGAEIIVEPSKGGLAR